MKFILISALLVTAITLAAYLVPAYRAATRPAPELQSADVVSKGASAEENVERIASTPQSTGSDGAAEGALAAARALAGEPMDPNDESTLPPRTERISIGRPMDPNDESTLPPRTERISVGVSMDPNDETTLPQRTEQVSVGKRMAVD